MSKALSTRSGVVEFQPLDGQNSTTPGILYLYDGHFTHWHGIWHVFVLVGSTAHFTAILLFVA